MKDALALALVHFLWQGALLALAGAVLMRVTRVPTVRYAIGVATMIAMLLAPVLTFLAIQKPGDAAPHNSTITSRSAAAANDARTPASTSVAPEADAPSSAVIIPTTWILNVWAVGVMVLSLRFAGGWAVARRLATQTLRPAREDLQALAAQMAARLKVRGAVRVCESASVAVPMMLGWLRPVIILPPAAVVALPLGQLEALLAHELAHIRRHDYLVNLLQTGVETLCFYHPAVWWISREVRRHREHCCDDIAVGVCDRLTYVSALSSLASIATPQFALSAAGGSLRDRVRRLIEPTTHSASPKGAWIAMLPILLVISFVAPQAWSTQGTPPATAVPVVSPAVPAVAAPSAPEVVPVEQTRSSTAAREAERDKAVAEFERVKELMEQMKAVQSEAQLERARELMKRVSAGQAEAQLDEAKKLLEIEQGETRREAVRAREAIRAAEGRRALKADNEAQAVTQEVARRRIERAREANEQALLETQLLAAEMTVLREKQLVEKGLTTQQNVLAAEAQVTQLRRQLELVKSHRMLMEDVEGLRKHQIQELEERGLVAHRNLSPLDASTPLQAQDRLTINIDGEPDLPTTFTVREDGSIRFPFLGSIRVQGSTTSQVQTAIQKLISDKGLARNPVVHVSASRPR